MSEPSYSLLGLWPIINRWKKLVGLALVLALVASIVVALLLPNVYKSTAVFFPTNPQTTDPDRIATEGSKLELGGRTEDLDRVITIGESQPVAELIIKRFRLHQHYATGPVGDDAADDAALRKFSSNLDIVHNERDAIELTFFDEDKQLAARIANALVQVIDSVNQQLTLENRRNVLGIYQQRYQFLNKEFETSRQKLIQARRHYGIYGLEQQSRYLAREIIKVESELRQAEGEGEGGKAAGLRRALRGLTRSEEGNVINLEDYTRGVDSLNLFTARMTDLQARLVKARGDFETADVALKGKLSSLYLVQKAYPATKKSKPIRWLIVAGSVFLTLALSIVVITLLELWRRTTRRPAGPAAL
ncbi:GumC domain-containing protein [Hymenobacter metallilatus]|uniref:Polysaccharide chain length determinant N-terminal domain-containing protein n=1 Tax=Hymenobacter metallilatus TaxID=2493666 RepID=A0A3R9NDL8_9BACT|nr:hypothetical protein [Hymenobacter metallilatus]RSK29486.1 hypothetical protein EI290_16545 [Hymenobacter metallilatus]